MRKLNILFVEDDKYFRQAVTEKILAYGDVKQAESASEAMSYLKQGDVDVAFIDLDLGGELDGLRVIEASVAKGVYPIVLTGYGQKEIIAKAYELGCKHYFSKREFQSDVERLVGPYLMSLRSNGMQAFIQKEFVTQDAGLKQVFENLQHQSLNRDQRALILGPTGTGKTKIARLIHMLAEGNESNFVHINVAELPENLVESILFGHKKGAFTGAVQDQDGLLKKADGGTLFLDEIGSISLALQKKLLKVLEDKSFSPLGSTEVIRSDFRLLTATCEDIGKLIEEKLFRIDFYFRIKGMEITIPALKDRRDDIPLLVDHFIRQSPRKILITDSALAELQAYDWYGNVRELESLVKELCSRPIGVVNISDLPSYIRKNRNPYRPVEGSKVYTKPISQFIQKHGLRKLFEVLEQEAFKEISHKLNGNLSKTQATLKISKSAAYRIQESIRTQPADSGIHVQ